MSVAQVILMIGSTALRMSPKAAKTNLSRFSGSKIVPKPTPSQLEKASTLSQYTKGNMGPKELKRIGKTDSARPSWWETLTGTGSRNPKTPSIKPLSGETQRAARLRNVGVGMTGLGTGAMLAGADKVVKVAKSAVNKIKELDDKAAMTREIRKAAKEAGYTKEEVAKVVDQNAGFVAGKTTKLDLDLKNRKKFEGEADLPYAKSPIMNKGGPVPKPRKKPHSPIYTPEVYKKFKNETRGMSQEDTDAYIARRGRNKGGTVIKKKPVKKLAKGGFPDLTGDGKVTKKDVLKGRGVAMNMGGMKKQYGAKNYMSGGYVMGKKKK
jgi:hypothetical protein